MITTVGRDAQEPTRERLLREGLRLFATRGFAGTTVGEIEAAAGLAPRRGALYNHFSSKEALLDAAVARYNETASEAVAEFAAVQISDPRALAVLFGRWLLARLDEQREIIQVLEHEGTRLVRLRDEFRKGTEAGFAAAATVIHRWLAEQAIDADAETISVILLGGLINFRRSTWTLGGAPLALDDERFLAGFADMFEILVSPS
jgi:AcrR family transcriptional regulator